MDEGGNPRKDQRRQEFALLATVRAFWCAVYVEIDSGQERKKYLHGEERIKVRIPSSGRVLISGTQLYLPRKRGHKTPQNGIAIKRLGGLLTNAIGSVSEGNMSERT